MKSSPEKKTLLCFLTQHLMNAVAGNRAASEDPS